MKNFYKRIKARLQGKPYFPTELHHPVVFAFESGGIKYYQFENIFNMAHGRAFKAMDYYNEYTMRCTREHLDYHTRAIDNILSTKSITVKELLSLQTLNNQLKERLQWIIAPDILWKLGAVVYFDEKENPYDYDFAYGNAKIEKWKKHDDIRSFFLNKPIAPQAIFTDISEQDLENYIQVGEKLNKEHLKTIFDMSSSEDKKTDFFKALRLES